MPEVNMPNFQNFVVERNEGNQVNMDIEAIDDAPPFLEPEMPIRHPLPRLNWGPAMPKRKKPVQRPEISFLPVILDQLEAYMDVISTGDAADFYEQLVNTDKQLEKLIAQVEERLPD